MGSVVISDHLTGDPSEEHDCLEKPVSHHMHYVGSRELVAAVKQFIHEKSIQAINLDASKTAIEHAGTYVVFYDDANFRLFMDGHRLFDLSEREQSDQHGVTMLDRLEQIVTASAGSYRADDFSGTGFLVTRDGSTYDFSDGVLDATQLTGEGYALLARRLVPISLLARFSGPCDRSPMVTLAKRHIVHKAEATFSPRSKPDRDTRDFIALFRKAGLKETSVTLKTEEPVTPFSSPRAAAGFCPCSFRIVEPDSIVAPDGTSWLGGTAPTLVAGVPYRHIPTLATDSLTDSYIKPLRRLISDRTRRRIDDSGVPTPALFMAIAKDGSLPPSDRLMAALLSWNIGMIERLSEGEEHPIPEIERDRIESLVEMAPVAVLADLASVGESWVCLYRVPERFSLGRIGDNRRAIEKIDAYLSRQADDEHFASERERLLTFLKRLIEEDTIEKVQAPPPPPDRGSTENDERDDGAAGDDTANRQAGRDSTSKQGSAAATAAGSGKSGESSSRRRGLLVLLILLIAGGLAFWFFRDSILPVFGATDVAAEASSAEDGGTSDDPADTTEADTTGSNSGDEAALLPPDGIPNPTDEQLEAFSDLVPDGSGLDTVFVVGEDGFSITIRDILTMVNRIAVTNGYDMLGEESPNGLDPNWIYPGSLMLLPDVDMIMIERGDTLWWIAHDFLLDSLIGHVREFTLFRQRVENGEKPAEELRELERRVYVESLRNELAALRNQL